ncbi:MAG: hypothetical protein RIT27_638 [Pseudomonadota bacterium]|jgi:hypothetical protein
MAVNYDDEHKLILETKAQQTFAADVLRVLRSVVRRMQSESRKNWTSKDLIDLIDTLIVEITTGVTDEDHQRRLFLKAGETAFNQGQPRSSNPYDWRNQPNENKWWDTGWHDAERQQQLAADKITDSKPMSNKVGRYRVQVVRDAQTVEWNEVLYMFVKEGAGTRYAELVEAQALAQRFKAVGETAVHVVDSQATSS